MAFAVSPDRDNQKKLATDAMFKLEHGVQDQGKAKETKSNLALIADAQSGWKDDFALNQLARNKFRVIFPCLLFHCVMHRGVE